MAAELVEALRHQRHRFQNHLQVISGWLQLGKPERASAYLATLRQSREQESQLYALADWRLLARLLEKHALAEANGVPLTWHIETPATDASLELTEWLAERFDAALHACLAAGPGCRLEIALREHQGQYDVQVDAWGPADERLAGGDAWKESFAASAAAQ